MCLLIRNESNDELIITYSIEGDILSSGIFSHDNDEENENIQTQIKDAMKKWPEILLTQNNHYYFEIGLKLNYERIYSLSEVNNTKVKQIIHKCFGSDENELLHVDISNDKRIENINVTTLGPERNFRI